MIGLLAIADLLVRGVTNMNELPKEPRLRGITPLIAAIIAKSPPLIQFLLDQGADPMKEGWRGYTPLQIAQDEGDENVIELVKNAIRHKLGQEEYRASFYEGSPIFQLPRELRGALYELLTGQPLAPAQRERLMRRGGAESASAADED